MNPIALLLGGGTLGLGMYQLFRKPKKQDFQTQEIVTPTGIPVKVVTPIPRNVTASQKTATVLKPGGPSGKAAVPQVLQKSPSKPATTVFAPPKTITQTAPGKFEPPPIIVTPTGSSSVGISSTKDVQRALNTLGYQPRLVEDGILGPKTVGNIKQFQAKTGLVVDGSAGPATKSALSTAVTGLAQGKPVQRPVYSTLSQTQLGPYDTSVNKKKVPAPSKPVYSTLSQTQLGPYDTAPNRAPSAAVGTQRALNMLGANPPLVEDGKIGPKTVAAIKSFQMSKGLVADGIAGPKTKAALSAAIGGTAVAGDFACGEEVIGHDFNGC